MYPEPPDLAHVSGHLSDAELFWIVKHGIKASGMPSWGDHSDEELWATVSFVKKLPGMAPEQYAELARMAGGHYDHTSGMGATQTHEHGSSPRHSPNPDQHR